MVKVLLSGLNIAQTVFIVNNGFQEI
jgi:hypothetical protein